ncbi:hypothetical protein BRADI_3g04300v3 [Brachypodium distachyon]|uniref:Uncharacterized protein n=1 Tax=Brachypodium distachyon TaxID=15368 RepID=A0A0Q3J547_BRADI|nr:hypothetical protein BRADI_3g04300v3 [Brachypodium distachyon]
MQPLDCSYWKYWNFLLALVLLVSLASLTSSCMEQEKASLLHLLAGLSRDGGLAASWESHKDCCRWEGITCSPNRMVTDVSLASQGLEGSISPHLGNLTGQLRLNLSCNWLSGVLPLELVLSSSIIVLDISFNCLTGGLSELPSSTPARPLQVMKSLVAINASTNSFTGQIPTIPCASSPYFTVLELSFNQFSGNIPPGLSNCSELKILSTGYNNLNGTLPDELFNITSLEHRSLPNNWIKGALNGINKLTNLVTLDLGMNELSSNIPDSIGELKRLVELHLGHNNMSGDLPTALSNCTENLDLLYNNFTGTIPESIYSSSKMTALRLSQNHFHGKLSEKIGNLKSLSFLSLRNISLTNMTRTLQILGSSRSLTTLLIGFNFMDDTMPEDDRIDGFQNLQILAINDCSLSGKIPHWLSKFRNLRMLFLQNNQLTGPIPDWISSLNALFYLDITNNSIKGEIPISLMDVPMLKSDNTAPKVFELPVYDKSPFMQYLRLGSFPKVLYLGLNNLSGVIPKEIGQLQALVALNLSFNRLSGEIPQQLCTLTNMQMLDLSGNHLTGTIPSALNNLHFLSKFNISNNDLEGPIPTVGQLSTFPYSSFDGNPKLCGPVLVNQCGLAEADPVSIVSTKQYGTEVIFAIAFGVFFGVGVLYDQMVLARYFG